MGSSHSLSQTSSNYNQMHNKLKNFNVCDAACQKKRKLQKLKTTYINSKNLLRNAPTRFKSAEKAYYTELNGEAYYSTIKEKEYNEEAKKIVNKWNNSSIATNFAKLENQIGYFTTQYIYTKNIENVHKNWINKLKTIRRKVEKTLSKKRVNDRLGYFYDYNTNVVNSMTYYLKIFYWVLIVPMFIIFLYKKQYHHFDYYPFIISILLLPFLLDYFYEYLMNNFKYFTINNFYFIFFTLFVLIIFSFQKMSTSPFSSEE